MQWQSTAASSFRTRLLSIASHLVIRDKSSAKEPLPDTAKEKAFASFDSEETKIQFRGENRSVLIQHPIPDASASASVAHIDWLGFSLRVSDDNIRSWLLQQIETVFDLKITETKKAGWNGFKHCALLGKYGFVAWGGRSQRGKAHIEINGTGCSTISNWTQIKEWGEKHDANITRVDLAHDDLDGKFCNAEQILEWCSLRGFNAGGRDVKVKIAGDCTIKPTGEPFILAHEATKCCVATKKGSNSKIIMANGFELN